MRLVSVVAAVLLVGFLVAGVGVVSASQPDISVDNSIDTPEETIEIEGSSYEVSAVAEREPGDPLTADVTIPDGSSGELDLYASDETVADWENVEDGDSATFDTSQLEPGTYMLALQIDGSYEAVHPVIISGYDITLSHPTEATPSESITVTADVVQTHVDEPPADVDVIVHGAGETNDVTADQIDDDTYETTVTFDDHTEGEYQVYATVRNGGETAGYPTLLGAKAGDTITVSAQDDDSSDDDDQQGDDDSDNGEEDTDSDDESDSEQEQEDEQDEDESEETEHDEETDNGEEDDSDSDDEEHDNDSDDSDDADDEESEDSDEDSSVIEPNGDGDESEPVDDEQSLSLAVPVVSLLIAGLVATRRSHL